MASSHQDELASGVKNTQSVTKYTDFWHVKMLHVSKKNVNSKILCSNGSVNSLLKKVAL